MVKLSSGYSKYYLVKISSGHNEYFISMVVLKFNRKEVSTHLKTFSSGHNNFFCRHGCIKSQKHSVVCASFGERTKYNITHKKYNIFVDLQAYHLFWQYLEPVCSAPSFHQ